VRIDELFLVEASIGRVMKHVQDSESFAIMTSWRVENDIQKNISDFKRLQSMIRAEGLGYIHLDGHGQEEDETGRVVDVKEPSLLIPNISLASAERLMKTFNQFGIVYRGSETNEKVSLIEQGGKQTKLGSFHPNKVAQFFSKIKGRPFVFESQDW